MAKYRLDCLAELQRQFGFAPTKGRLSQLDAAEELLHEIDPAKAYPPDYIVFRLTGFSPTKGAPSEQLTGLALQHDLGLFLEQCSDSLDLPADAQMQPVLDLDQACERFSVSSKTIQRWRRRGLPARRYVFSDGRKRIGFLLSSVERFIARNRDHVAAAGNFTQMSADEASEAVRHARSLVSICGGCENELSRRVARRLNRSPMTVLHLLRKHDEANPHDTLLTAPTAPLGDEQRLQIIEQANNGVSLHDIAKQLRRPRVVVYRVLLEDRFGGIAERKVKFIDDELFHQPEAGKQIDEILQQEAIEPTEMVRVPKGLPAYLQELYRHPLLTQARERGLFLRYNYLKYRYAKIRRKIDEVTVKSWQLRRLEALWESAMEVRNQIAEANLRLVVSVARRHLRSGVELMELVSEGNIILLRAIEGFDISRGHRFSTYATLALMKGYARAVPQMLNKRAGGSGELIETVADGRNSDRVARMESEEQLAVLLSRLNKEELGVVKARFGLGEEACSLREAATHLGLSRQRVRRLEDSAMRKLGAHQDESRDEKSL